MTYCTNTKSYCCGVKTQIIQPVRSDFKKEIYKKTNCVVATMLYRAIIISLTVKQNYNNQPRLCPATRENFKTSWLPNVGLFGVCGLVMFNQLMWQSNWAVSKEEYL